MKQVLIVSCAILLSCSNLKSRKPAQSINSNNSWINQAREIKDLVAKREINPDTCESILSTLADTYNNFSSEKISLDQMRLDGEQILNENFEARLALHSMLKVFPESCRLKLKEVFLNMRAADDYIGVHFYNDLQVAAETIKFDKEPIPVYEASAYRPYRVGFGIDANTKFEFRNGDIMITKGVSFVSSTISEIGVPQSLFSHIVFVHVDKKTNEVTTIESYVGKGVGIYSIEDALRNENSRILVLRSKDADLASRAADYMYDKVMALKKENKVIPYDYDLDFTNNSKLSCEEVAFDAFKTVSNNQVILPETMSEVTMTDANFLKRIGIHKGKVMVPADMETDSRFDIVLDWTDYRLMRDSWRKDAVLSEMFRWIEDYKYQIHENFTSVSAKAIWSTRYIPGVWTMMSKISGIPKDFMKDVPTLTIGTMASLKTIGGLMLPEVIKSDEKYFQKKQTWLSASMLRKSLDDYRKTEPEKLRKVLREKNK